MTPEEIARRYEKKAGYELVDYSKVALPINRLTVDSVTMVHQEIPPIMEFAMKSIDADLVTEIDIGEYLGLDISIIKSALEQLSDIQFTRFDDEGDLELTEKGNKALREAQISRPQDEMLVFLYDRLKLCPVRIQPDLLLSPSQIDPKDVIEIRPYPAMDPNLASLSVPQLTTLLNDSVGGRAEFGRDILALKRIVRRVRLYRPAVGLVYKKIHSSEILIDFIVDDVRDTELSNCFSQNGGPKKMGFMKSIEKSPPLSNLQKRFGEDLSALLPDQAEVDNLSLSVSTNKIKFEAAKARYERALEVEEIPPPRVREEFSVAEESLREAESKLSEFAARPVAPFELAELLEQALLNSENLLMVSGYQLDGHVVDGLFIKRLDNLLESGVRVVFTLSKEFENNVQTVEIEKLRQKYSNFQIILNGSNRLLSNSSSRRSFHLVMDHVFAVVANRSFLGIIGKAKTFERAVGFIVRRKDLVEAYQKTVDARKKIPLGPPRKQNKRSKKR